MTSHRLETQVTCQFANYTSVVHWKNSHPHDQKQNQKLRDYMPTGSAQGHVGFRLSILDNLLSRLA